jgi:hypothetical protein
MHDVAGLLDFTVFADHVHLEGMLAAVQRMYNQSQCIYYATCGLKQGMLADRAGVLERLVLQWFPKANIPHVTIITTYFLSLRFLHVH